MHKHRIFIIVAAALAVISTFLPWGSFNAGAIGSFSVSGIQAGHGGLSLFYLLEPSF